MVPEFHSNFSIEAQIYKAFLTIRHMKMTFVFRHSFCFLQSVFPLIRKKITNFYLLVLKLKNYDFVNLMILNFDDFEEVINENGSVLFKFENFEDSESFFQIF